MNKQVNKQDGVWIFYAIFVVFFFIEGAINRGLLWIARYWFQIHETAGQVFFAWLMFIIGGSLLAFLTLWRTDVEQALRDPIMRFARWLWYRFHWYGYVLDAVLVAALGTVIVLKAENHPNRIVLSILAATIFASVWVPLYTLVWH